MREYKDSIRDIDKFQVAQLSSAQGARVPHVESIARNFGSLSAKLDP
jgi:hypothetical protein